MYSLISVPSPVLSVKVTETGSNHFIFTWGRPLELNGNLKAYIIGYKTGTYHVF